MTKTMVSIVVMFCKCTADNRELNLLKHAFPTLRFADLILVRSEGRSKRPSLTVTPDKRAGASASRGLWSRLAPGLTVGPGSRSLRSLGRADNLSEIGARLAVMAAVGWTPPAAWVRTARTYMHQQECSSLKAQRHGMNGRSITRFELLGFQIRADIN